MLMPDDLELEYFAVLQLRRGNLRGAHTLSTLTTPQQRQFANKHEQLLSLGRHVTTSTGCEETARYVPRL